MKDSLKKHSARGPPLILVKAVENLLKQQRENAFKTYNIFEDGWSGFKHADLSSSQSLFSKQPFWIQAAAVECQ